MILLGYFLDSWVSEKFGFELKDNIEAITIGIILITTLPVLYKLFFARKSIVPVQPVDNDNQA